MEIQPIAYFESPLKSKFGIPRQSGLVGELTGRIVFEPPFRREEAVRGLEQFDYLWLIWEFSGNPRKPGYSGYPGKSGKPGKSGVPGDARTPGTNLTVRPPRLGGNERIGVFASRSPFRPNPLGLSCVKVERVELDAKLGPVIWVKGADLMDGTPIYDVKPYVAYADAHPEARSGFVDEREWKPLEVVVPEEWAARIPKQHLQALRGLLAQDPRPRYHDNPERVYGLPFLDLDVRFRVEDGVLTVVEVVATR